MLSSLGLEARLLLWLKEQAAQLASARPAALRPPHTGDDSCSPTMPATNNCARTRRSQAMRLALPLSQFSAPPAV